MKVCTVLVSQTSKRPIKLLSHADRQKSDGEGRAGKKAPCTPPLTLGLPWPGSSQISWGVKKKRGHGDSHCPGKWLSIQCWCPGSSCVLTLKPCVRNTNQMCPHQVMRGSPHPVRPSNDRMQLLWCFPGCRLLPLQNKLGEDEGGDRLREEGHYLMPLIASQGNILRRHREAQIQGSQQQLCQGSLTSTSRCARSQEHQIPA